MSTKKPATTLWDSADYLETDQDIAEYLDAVIEEGDAELLVHAVGVVARANGMTEVANLAGLDRESLDEVLSAKDNPGLRTIIKIIKALGLRLRVAALS